MLLCVVKDIHMNNSLSLVHSELPLQSENHLDTLQKGHYRPCKQLENMDSPLGTWSDLTFCTVGFKFCIDCGTVLSLSVCGLVTFCSSFSELWTFNGVLSNDFECTFSICLRSHPAFLKPLPHWLHIRGYLAVEEYKEY